MLRSVKLENFRCFRDATANLGPLTAFVGPNASGKTALLRAIAGHDLQPQLRHVWQHQKGLQARIAWTLASGIEETFAFPNNALPSNRPFGAGQYLHLDPRLMRGAQQLSQANQLEVDGNNLVSVFAGLTRRVQERLVQDLCRLIPVLTDVNDRPLNNGQSRLIFTDRWSKVEYEPSEVSDGTILTLGLSTLQYQQGPAKVVAIEEPERGLHPYLLGELVDVLRKLARGEVGPKPLQIVLATQSAELLEFLEPEEVRFLNRRAEDGSVTIEQAPTDTPEWRAAYQAHQESLGSVWLSGSLGGIPTGS